MVVAVIKQIESDESGDLIVTVDFPHEECKDHSIMVPALALKRRMELYGLKTEKEALDAIIREHTLRLCDDIAPEGEEKLQQLGGLHAQIKVSRKKTSAKA